jgi:hypothetical protein
LRSQVHRRLPFLLDVPANKRDVYFAVSNSIVSFPTLCSDSAIRAR